MLGLNRIKNTPGEHQNRAREPVFALSFKEHIIEKFQNVNKLSSNTKRKRKEKSNEGET